ncbi:hypothetical protein [Sphingosinicella sp. BN140058]|uniref:hypothetical protein n=1 Tax=Sphingosinicella sp. BN140058 TaxID=1892855 RepID=UPI0010111E83|nr:hypothetical protein [Sphingosinicella sp. BN140058]QAY75610.1 hypothetical protein ETR14_03005 [Sphingosinicella sp. BN140058]
MPSMIEALPLSTLELLNDLCIGKPDPSNARRWAGDILATGISSDALIETALLRDDEWQRAGELVHQALEDGGILKEPRWQIALTFLRLLMRAYLDAAITAEEFSDRFEHAYADQPSAEGIPEAVELPLRSVYKAAVMYSPFPRDRTEYPAYIGDDQMHEITRLAAGQLTG